MSASLAWWMRPLSPHLIIDIYVPLPSAFGTHGGASEALIQWFFDDYVWNNGNICTGLAFVWMSIIKALFLKKSFLRSLEALSISYYYYLASTGYVANWSLLILGVLKAHLAMKLTLWNCCGKDLATLHRSPLSDFPFSGGNNKNIKIKRVRSETSWLTYCFQRKKLAK